MTDELVPTVSTPVTLQTYVRAVIRAWRNVSDAPCTREAVAVLWAQYIMETGGKNCFGWNIGNVKYSIGCGYDYHCLHGVWEGLAKDQAARLIARGDAVLDENEEHIKQVGKNRVAVVLKNGHPATRFVCYPSLEAAMAAQLKLLAAQRFKSAWPAVLAGDVDAFATALHEKGYFTATAKSYADGMRRPYKQACASDAFEIEHAEYIATLERPTNPEIDSVPPSSDTRTIHPWLYTDEPPPDSDPNA